MFSTDERSDRRTRDRFAFDQPEQANHGRLRGTGRIVRQWLSRHHRTNQPFGLRDHDDVAWRGLGGETRRYVDRRTRYGRAVRAMRDRQDLPCRQTDAEEERIGIACRSGRRRELRRRSDCSQRIILASDQEPEHGGHAVGIRQIDGAAMPLDRATDDVHGPTSDRLEDLRVERVLVARVNTLRTQHGDDPAVSPYGEARSGPSRAVVATHPGSESPLQSLQVRAWIKTKLVRQVPPSVLVGLERFALPTVAIEREHEQAPQPFASGMLADVPAELGDDVPTQTDVDPQLVQLFDRLQAELFET